MSTASAADRVRLEASWKAALLGEFEKSYMLAPARVPARGEAGEEGDLSQGGAHFRCSGPHPRYRTSRWSSSARTPTTAPAKPTACASPCAPAWPCRPSLVNIFREINDDLGTDERRLYDDRGCLESWAQQGVLLLNAVLTVERGRAGSHQGQGWEAFTDEIVQVLNREREGLVFMLWGSYAQKKGAIVDRSRHCVLTAPHPSPLSAHRGFLGCKHFSAANTYLQERGATPIDWFKVG